MKSILSLLMILVLAASCKKNTPDPSCTRQFSVQSGYTSASYDIRVALPCNYDPEHKKYASVYVLDGDDNFEFVAAEAAKLARKYSTEPVLVVAIGYGNDRSMDYTPSKAKQGGGGAPQFMEFVRHELIPRVEKEVAADTSRKGRVIIGHSLGGLCAAYAFTNHNQLFGNYLLLSPSLWYDDEVLLQYERNNREKISRRQQLVFMGLGGLENSGRMLAPFESFYSSLSQNYSNILLTRHFAKGMQHSGSKKPNTSKALEFYFQNKQQ